MDLHGQKGQRRKDTSAKIIPRNCVALLGGANSVERNYLLWKNGQTLVIQAPALYTEEEVMTDVPPDAARRELLEEEWKYGLQCIHALLNTVEFGKGNWGYLVSNKHGGYQIMQKQRCLRKVISHTWAPLIGEEEITYAEFWDANARGGYWKGRQVDVCLGYDDFSMRILEHTMMGHWLIRGMDLSYEVLAHVVDKDGLIIGLVTEADLGRLPQYRDRALVYEAVSRLQQRGIVYISQTVPFIMILHGKVRFTNMPALSTYDDPKDFEEAANKFHWKQLEQLFSWLDPDDFVPRPSWMRRIETPLVYMSECPTPERPIFVYFGFFDDCKRVWEPPKDLVVDMDDALPKSRRRKLLLESSGRAASAKTNMARDAVGGGIRRHKNSHSSAQSPHNKPSAKLLLPRFTDTDSQCLSSEDTVEIYSPQIVDQRKIKISSSHRTSRKSVPTGSLELSLIGR